MIKCPPINSGNSVSECRNDIAPPVFEIRGTDLYLKGSYFAKLKRKEGNYQIFEVVAENKFMKGVEIKLLIRNAE